MIRLRDMHSGNVLPVDHKGILRSRFGAWEEKALELRNWYFYFCFLV